MADDDDVDVVTAESEVSNPYSYFVAEKVITRNCSVVTQNNGTKII